MALVTPSSRPRVAMAKMGVAGQPLLLANGCGRQPPFWLLEAADEGGSTVWGWPNHLQWPWEWLNHPQWPKKGWLNLPPKALATAKGHVDGFDHPLQPAWGCRSHPMAKMVVAGHLLFGHWGWPNYFKALGVVRPRATPKAFGGGWATSKRALAWLNDQNKGVQPSYEFFNIFFFRFIIII